MENRDRDKLSRNSQSTEAGDINRDVSSRKGNLEDDSTSEFGQNIGRSENLNEPNRREGIGSEGMRGNVGRSGDLGSSESKNIGESEESELGSDVDRSGSSRGEH